MARVAWNRSNKDKFVDKAKMVHGDRYDYSLSEYKDYHTKVTIICNDHGEFLQKPSHHCAGIGCPSCGKERTAAKLSQGRESYVALARSIHGDRYDYKLVEYKNRHTKIKIICKEHGVWESSAHSHVSGEFCGCPSCGLRGFNKDRPAFLYVLSCGDITKIGVTNRSPTTRAIEVSESFGSDFHVVASFFFGNGEMASNMESKMLRTLSKIYKRVSSKFDGSTECFLCVDRSNLIRKIEEERNV